MAETAINVVFSKFGELATRELAVLLQVGGDIMQLGDQLEWLQPIIRDTDRKRRAGTVDGLTRVWVRQTRNAAFDAEDALDEFFHKVDLRGQGDGSLLRYLTSWWSEITVRHRLSGQIKSITSTLDRISVNQKQYNVEHTPSRIWTSSATAFSPRDDPQIIKEKYIENNVNYLKNLLDVEIDEKMVISVVGKSGSGKNTLLDAVCKKMMWQVHIWYNMPPDSSTQDVLKQVYKRAYKRINKTDPPYSASEEDMAAKLRELLEGMKYLVILCGISSKTMLNCVWASLPDNNNCSRVVLILESGHYDVAKHGADTLNKKMKEGTILWLSRWDEDTSARLFQDMVKDSGDGVFKVSGSEVGKPSGGEVSTEDKQYVYAMTEGNPLAIVVLAGLLRHKEPVERETLLKQLDQNASRMPAIERILSACYDDLPQDLKSCLLYLAAYPKNITQPAEQIVRMWTAEGFIRRRKGKTPEELGRMYLDELISRCLVTRIRTKDKGSPQKVLVHGRVLEFLQSEARQANFIDIQDRCDVLEPAVVRRLSIQDDGNRYTPSKTRFPKLRSFICRVEEEAGQIRSSTTSTWCWWSSMLSCLGLDLVLGAPAGHHDISFLCKSRFLRVLSVQGLGLVELPEGMGDMIHLRYIRVKCKGLKKLPSSIWKLLNLETLDITGTDVEEIHPRFWTIKALRHVLAEMLTLPAASSVPEELGELQTLHGVKPAQGDDNCPLHKMTKLRSLELHGLESSKHRVALADVLKKMHLLGHLKLEGDVIPSCIFTAPNLRCLQTIVLQADTDVEWEHIPQNFNVHHARPNLVQLKLKDKSKVPGHIQCELGNILIEDKNL
ncbi:hypothetical protein ACQ4PT_029380 [Festuca glaucescens]